MVETIKMKKINFVELMKEFKKYVDKKDTLRPVLRYVYFDGENFVATNSHVLLKVNAKHVSDIPKGLTKGSFYCPNKMEIVYTDKKYPDTKRLFMNDCNLSIRIDNRADEINSCIREGYSLIDKKTRQKNRLFEFIMQDGYMEFRALENLNRKSQHILKHGNVLQSNGDEIKFKVRAIYARNALITVRKLYKLSDDDTEMRVVSSMRPILFKKEGVFDLMVLPVRVH